MKGIVYINMILHFVPCYVVIFSYPLRVYGVGKNKKAIIGVP